MEFGSSVEVRGIVEHQLVDVLYFQTNNQNNKLLMFNYWSPTQKTSALVLDWYGQIIGQILKYKILSQKVFMGYICYVVTDTYQIQ